jgi:hypothetical protein
MATTKGKPRGAKAGAKGRAKTAGLVDEGLKRRWQEALTRYRKARDEEVAGWDERYEALGEILDSDPPYYLGGGYKTARAFLQAEVPDQDERTVRTAVRVARWFDPDDEARHGISKLDALLTYLEAAGGAPLAPAKIHLAKQTIRVPQGRSFRTIPFADAAIADLRAATRAAGQRAGKITKTSPPVVQAIQAALSQAKLRAVAVRLSRGRVALSGIAPDDLARLGKALGSLKLPPRAAPAK